MNSAWHLAAAVLAAGLAACSARAPSAEDFSASLPASYQRQAPGANSLIDWHLDLLPGGEFRLRTTYVDKPEPRQFDELGQWRYDPDGGRLTLEQGEGPPLLFAVAAGGAQLHKLDDAGNPVAADTNPPLVRLAQAALIEVAVPALPDVVAPLRGTYWRLVELDGRLVEPASGARPAHLQFALDENRVAGSGGCNRISGGFALEGDGLSFTQMISTRMACLDGDAMATEQGFLAALGKVESHRTGAAGLELLDAAGMVLAHLQAAEPPQEP